MNNANHHITDISISTATINIQVIRIGAKQMTLAVFRQLQRKDIFDELGNLLAMPWGWVNHEEHARSFLFAYNDILYRYDIPMRRYEGEFYVFEDINYEEAHTDRATGKWVEGHDVRTGLWCIGRTTVHEFSSALCDLSFNSEAEAQEYLSNALKSVAVLEAAPQLFIAV